MLQDKFDPAVQSIHLTSTVTSVGCKKVSFVRSRLKLSLQYAPLSKIIRWFPPSSSGQEPSHAFLLGES